MGTKLLGSVPAPPRNPRSSTKTHPRVHNEMGGVWGPPVFILGVHRG